MATAKTKTFASTCGCGICHEIFNVTIMAEPRYDEINFRFCVLCGNPLTFVTPIKTKPEIKEFKYE